MNFCIKYLAKVINHVNFLKMKTLGKLNINPDKLIRNEELLTLKGGYDGYCCWCVGPDYWGHLAEQTDDNCRIGCALINSIHDWKC